VQKTTKLKITTTRKKTISISISANRAFCAACRCEAQVITYTQAAQLLEMSQSQIEQLIAAGKLHAVRTVSSEVWICKDSLIS
jgi:excisionase family DNA binding protein